ncbi:MAG: hypothetical protein PHC61_14895, partial [Chitinivibrionales bacterium]|nr:hypothetical protein [Chitinivibrionales bacterium]
MNATVAKNKKFLPSDLGDVISLIYPLFYALLGLGIAVTLNFHQFHNDFWDNVFIARHLNPRDIQSWYSPFFPLAYNLFVKAITGKGFPVVPALLANLGFAMAYLYTARTLFRIVLSSTQTLAALVMLSIFPRLFWYVNAAGADPASILFFTLGALLIVRQGLRNQKENSWFLVFFGGGLLLGLGALCRYHVLVGGVLFLAAFWICYPDFRRRFVVAGVGLFMGYLPQIILSVATGHGIISTGYGIVNIYNLMYHLSWYQTVTLKLPSSAFSL